MVTYPLIGLCLRPDGAAWTVLHPGRDRQPESLVSNAASFDPPLAADTPLDEWSARLKTAIDGLTGPTAAALPLGSVLLRVVDLPTGDPSEVSGMVSLQADGFSPFPAENTLFGYEVLAVEGNRTRVLIAVALRDAVERLAALCAGAGLDVRWVDVDVLGRWRALVSGQPAFGEGQDVVLLVEDSVVSLVVLRDGSPVLFRSLGLSTDPVAEMAEELGYTLAAVAAEHGPASSTRLTVWHGETEAPADVLTRLEAVCGASAVIRSLEDLPSTSEGLARRAAGQPGMSAALNLAPSAWLSRRQSAAFRQQILRATIIFLAVWLLAVVVFWGGLWLERVRLTRLEAAVKRQEQPAEQVRKLQAKIRAFEGYMDRERSALECLREVSLQLPEGVSLSSFIFRKNEVSLKGEADTPEPIYAFMQKLQTSPLFYEVKPEGVTSRQIGAARRSQFGVVLRMSGIEEEAP